MNLLGPSSDTGPGVDMTMDELTDVIHVARRRWAIRFVAEHGATTIGELAEHRAADEQGTTPDRITKRPRKNVYVPLYQHHLPLLDEHDVIDYDERSGAVAPGPNCEPLAELLDDLDARVEVPA